MFKLVGCETFTLGGTQAKATIWINAITGFAYEYTLDVNGKNLEKFVHDRSKVSKTWVLKLDGVPIRIVLGKL